MLFMSLYYLSKTACKEHKCINFLFYQIGLPKLRVIMAWWWHLLALESFLNLTMNEYTYFIYCRYFFSFLHVETKVCKMANILHLPWIMLREYIPPILLCWARVGLKWSLPSVRSHNSALVRIVLNSWRDGRESWESEKRKMLRKLCLFVLVIGKNTPEAIHKIIRNRFA